MPVTLYDAIVPTQLQMLGSVERLVAKAADFCTEQGREPDDILDARLAPDMLTFSYQVKAVATHSLGMIEGVRRGSFSPDRTPPPPGFEGLTTLLTGAVAGLQAVTPDEFEGFIGRDMRFVLGDFAMEFTAENFLLSFGQPNFYFHASTAYDILRNLGLAVGKRDFLGQIRIKA